jgi:hypothetical protein
MPYGWQARQTAWGGGLFGSLRRRRLVGAATVLDRPVSGVGEVKSKRDKENLWHSTC